MQNNVSRRSFLRQGMLAGGAAVAGPALLAACGGGAAQPVGRLKTKLDIGVGLDFNDLNGFDLTINEYPLFPSLYDTLLTYDGAGNTVPRLATSWEIAPDGSSVKITLRKGATFHDGEPVNAQTFVANYQKATDPAFAYQVYSVISPIKDVTPTGELTLEMTMQAPTPKEVITDILDSINLMAPKALDFNALKHTTIGSGPFKLQSFTPGNQLVLTRFENWWRKPKPSLEQITFHISSDYDAAIASLQAGSLDMVAFVPPAEAIKVKDQFDIFVGPTGLEVYPLRINPQQAPFDNKMVRQGLHFALDRKQIVSKVFYGYSKPTVLLFGEQSPAFDNSALAKYPFDLQRAKQMFSAAGAPNWTATCYLVNTDVVGQSIVQVLQADLAKIGVTLQVQPIGVAESGARAFAGNYQMSYGIFGNCGKYPTWVTLNSLCRVANNPVLKGTATPILSRWTAAIDQANRATTKSAQETAFAQLRTVLLDESWVIPICQDETLVVTSKKSSGVRINRDDFVVLEDVKVTA